MPLDGVNRFEQLAVSSVAVKMTLTPSEGVIPMAAIIEVEDAAIRFTTDGTTPTATVGHNAEVGDIIELPTRGQVHNFSAIRRGGADAQLNITQAVGWVA